MHDAPCDINNGASLRNAILTVNENKRASLTSSLLPACLLLPVFIVGLDAWNSFKASSPVLQANEPRSNTSSLVGSRKEGLGISGAKLHELLSIHSRLYSLPKRPKPRQRLEDRCTRMSNHCARELQSILLQSKPTFAANLGLFADNHTLKNSWTLMYANLASKLRDSRLLQCVLSEHGIQLCEGVSDLVDGLVGWDKKFNGLCSSWS